MKTKQTKRRQTISLVIMATIFLLGAFASTFAQGEGAKYGARDPRTCADMKAPAGRGAMTAALATKYVICSQEHVGSGGLYLLEDVTIQVGGGVPYNARNFPYTGDIDPKSSVYPIRASYKQYQCNIVSEIMQNKGYNCNIYPTPKAEGVCLKTTFGDWRCSITSPNLDTSKTESNMPPPGGAKAVAADKNKPTAAPPQNGRQTAENKGGADENKHENGLPEPDLSEMEKDYEIVKYNYDIAAGKLNLLVKLKAGAVAETSWLVNFYDADGVKVIASNYNDGLSSALFAVVGEPERTFFFLPSESKMKFVKRVVITKKVC